MAQTNNSRWAIALVTMPLLTVLILGISYFGVYPILAQNGFTGMTVIKVIAGISCLLIPGIVSLLFKVNTFLTAMVWIAFTGLALFLDKGNYEGNQHAGLAGFLLGFQMAATAISTIIVSYQLKSKK